MIGEAAMKPQDLQMEVYPVNCLLLSDVKCTVFALE